MIHKSLKYIERKFSYLSQVSSDIFSDSILNTRNIQTPIRARTISANYRFYQHTCFHCTVYERHAYKSLLLTNNYQE